MISLAIYCMLLQPPVPKEAQSKYGPLVRTIESPAPKQAATCANGACEVATDVNSVRSQRSFGHASQARFHIRRHRLFRGRCGKGGGCG